MAMNLIKIITHVTTKLNCTKMIKINLTYIFSVHTTIHNDIVTYFNDVQSTPQF